LRSRSTLRLFVLVSVVGLIAAACSSDDPSTSASGSGNGNADCTPAESPIVTVTAYSNVYDVYGKLISTFQSDWKESHNDQQVQFSTSFGGSTTQAQNVVAGFPADVAALSLYPDIQLIEDAGLITHDPKQDPEGGIVATSAVVFDVRPGNPLNIDNWDDLAKPGVEILTPDPASSGGARWNIVAAYGAAMRGEVPGYAANDPAAAQQLRTDIFSNVTVMDKSANDSIKNFQAGNGDVALTYEYAVLAAQNSGLEDEMVIPPSTVAIQTPVSVVDANAATHCVQDVASAFVEFLHSDEAKELFLTVGYERSVDLNAAQAGDDGAYEPIDDLFTTDDLGGWDELQNDTVFGPDGAFTKALAAAQG
jgi:sulfate/thiosulfate transport system substrate-binding protein